MSLAIPAAVIDARLRIIPDKLNLIGIVISLPFLLQSKESLLIGLTGFAIGTGLLLLPVLLGHMGGGDLKFTATMGLFLGYGILPAVFIAVILAGLFGLTCITLKRKKIRDTMAFGPFLALGIIIVAGLINITAFKEGVMLF
jgi:Flp pilus assembly protein protease CpaA